MKQYWCGFIISLHTKILREEELKEVSVVIVQSLDKPSCSTVQEAGVAPRSIGEAWPEVAIVLLFAGFHRTGP